MIPRRFGFTLISLIAAIPLLLIALALAQSASVMLMKRGPDLGRRLGVYTSLRRLARQIEQDVEQVDPMGEVTVSADGTRLVLPLNDMQVVYEMEDDVCVRTAGHPDRSRQRKTFRFKPGRFSWGLHRIDGQSRAVCVRMSSQSTIEDHLLVFENVRLFFLPAGRDTP